jgi:serine/threonine-protein kinase
VHLARGDGEKAAVELAGALRVARSSIEALDAMGRLLLEAGEIEEGTRLVESVLAREEVLMARHTLARTHALFGDWERVDETLGDASLATGAVLPTLLQYMRFINWAPSERWREVLLERARALPVPAERKEQLARLAAIARGETRRDELNPLLELVMSGMPGLATRGVAFREQLRAEVLAGIGRPAEALEALRAADGAKLFDVVWLDRCPTLASVRGEPAFAEVRGHVAARALTIIAAYDRGRVSIRGRARRPA